MEKYYYSDENPSTAIVDAHYDAAVHTADKRLGKIIDGLKENEVFDETLLIVLSDHGESLTEHGIYYDHHGLYDVSTHIPLIIKPPGGGGRKIDEFVQITDIAPTILSYTKEDNPQVDGISLKSAIEEGKSINRDFVMAEEAHTTRRRMIRTEGKKLIYSLDRNTICRYCNIEHAPEVELYDLKNNPKERENLAKSSQEIVKNLRKKCESESNKFLDNQPEVGTEDISYEDEEEIHKRLRNLGYK